MTAAGSGDDPALNRKQLQDLAVRGTSWTLIHTVISLPIAFLANLALARILGVADYGRLAFLTVLIDVASGIVQLGLGAAVVQFGSRAHAAGHHDEVRRLLSASQGFRLLIAAPLLTLLVIAVADVDADLMVVAILFGVWVPATLDGALFCIIIENKTATGAKLAMLVNVVMQLAVVATAYLLRTPDAVWAVRLIVSGSLVVIYLKPISPEYRRAVLRPTLLRGFPHGFWRFAIPTGIAGLIGTLALSRTEVFFLTWLSTPESVGIFALAFGLAGHIFAPAQALIGPLIPAISGLHEVDEESLLPAFERVLRAGATVISLACAAGLPALALLVPAFYGAGFADSAPLLLALGVAGALLAAGAPVTAFTLGRLSSRRLLAANGVALVIDVAIALALIPALGAWGAAAANVAGAVSRLTILLQGETRALGLSWTRVSHQVMPAILSVPLAVAAWTIGRQLPWPPVLAAFAVAVCSLALLFASLRLTRSGLTHDDIAVISRSVPSPLARIIHPLMRAVERR